MLTDVTFLVTIVTQKVTDSEMTLADIILSDYRQRVLGLLLLNSHERFHLREIARQTDARVAPLSRELLKLSEAGILNTEQVGNQVHYFANLECPIYQELVSILRKTAEASDSQKSHSRLVAE